MVGNKKDKTRMKADLKLFLGDKTTDFVEWYFNYLSFKRNEHLIHMIRNMIFPLHFYFQWVFLNLIPKSRSYFLIPLNFGLEEKLSFPFYSILITLN